MKITLQSLRPLLIVSMIMLLTPGFSPQQHAEYDKLWKEIEHLKESGLPRSAMELLETLQQKAISEKNQLQLLKTAIYRIGLTQETEEDHLQLSISQSINQLPLLNSPAKEMMHSAIAELYWFYYQQNRYTLLDRTSLQNNSSEDIQEWDIPRLRQAIRFHYEASLKPYELLQNTRLEDYNAMVLEDQKEAYLLQPSLFDFLAHRAMAFYGSDDAGMSHTGPKPDFIHPQKKHNRLFAPMREFIRDSLPAGNYSGREALLLYQKLIFLNLNKGNTEALVYCELQRYKLAWEMSAHAINRDEDYLKALTMLQESFIHHPVSTDIAFERAMFMKEHSGEPMPGMALTQHWTLSEARQIALEAIKAFPESRGAANCRTIVADIEQKELGIEIQRVELPDRSIPVRLHYRNIEKTAFRLIGISSEKLERIMNLSDQAKQTASLLSEPVMKSWSLDLSKEDDFQQHSAIIELPACPTGLFVLMVSETEAFSTDHIIEFSSFQVSELSFISRKLDDNTQFFLLNRETGQAIANATIKVMSREYDRRNRLYKTEQRLQLKTAKDGSFNLGPDELLTENKSYYIEAETKNDRLLSDRYFDTYKSHREKKLQQRTWFFTDRAIYRTGQTIYFKGIMLETDGDKHEIKTKQATTVKFFDANYQENASLQLTTNAFGSFEGSFVIPAGALNGEMRIANENGSVGFSVEEYKRPTFEVKLDQPKEQVKLGEQVVVSGSAVAFAGFSLNSVRYTYRVMRQKHFPYWSFWWGRPPFGGENLLIASGEGMTRQNGSFSVEFTAWPDYGDTGPTDPVYQFTLLVDVTDRNGETRSSELMVPVGSKALLLSADIPGIVEKTNLNDYKIKAANLLQQGVRATVDMSITRLNPLPRLLRQAVFAPTDRNLIDSSRFVRIFPNDAFGNEMDPLRRKGELVFNNKVIADPTAGIFPASAQSWAEGEYLLELRSTDMFGKEVKLQQVFTLFDPATKAMPVNALEWFFIPDTEALPGESIHYSIGTSATKCRVLTEIFLNDKRIESRWINLSDEQITLPFRVLEEHRGMLRFQATFVRFNRLIHHSAVVKVPFTNKMLDITLETKRDKLTPGATETWNLRIKGKHQEVVAAELMAGMYDASLDQFRSNTWNFDLLNYHSPQRQWTSDNGFMTYNSQRLTSMTYPDMGVQMVSPPVFNWFGYHPFGYHHRGVMRSQGMTKQALSMVMDEAIESDAAVAEEEIFMVVEDNIQPGQGSKKKADDIPSLRTNFNETAFFYPQLLTNSDGGVTITFVLPDALTKWKLMLLAHSQDLKTGFSEHDFMASKAFMIVPNVPRFYREGDSAWVSAKVVNTGEKEVTGIVSLQITDAVTEKELPYVAETQKPLLKLAAGQSREIRWKINVGELSSLLSMRFTASAEGFSDGEQQWVPVLSRKVLVTETMPLRVGPNSTRKSTMPGLANSTGKKSHQLVIDFTSNPSWYAVQALPYLASGETDNADNLFNRFYANRMASHIAVSMPELRKVFEAWKTESPDALISNLEKNQQLKSILLNETPWVMDAESESQQKRNIALLFDPNRMRYEEQQSLKRLAELQLGNGGWPWFSGMPANRFTTQQIVTGIGRLKHLGLITKEDQALRSAIARAVRFLDEEMTDDFIQMKKRNGLKDYKLSPIHLNYLYARSYFMDIPVPDEHKPAYDFYLGHAETDWLTLNPGLQAMVALTINRNGKFEKALEILASLLERSILNEETGRYWKQASGYFWYETPVESQALLIEAFEVLSDNTTAVDEMRSWLLSNKQTHRWPSSRATAEAVYALLIRGTDWISQLKPVEVKVGGVKLQSDKTEAGTGYISQQWEAAAINPSLAVIDMHNPNPHSAWGGVYWQYFADIDQLASFVTPMKISKELFVEKTGNGEMVLVPVDKQAMKIGDRVKVRIVLEVDRDMEFVHLKDYRAAAFEPINVLSGYRYQGGLGYYETTRDASTDFFFAHLPRGRYVFEYTLVASQSGEFAHGYALIQCHYAPEFSARSTGKRIKVVQ